MKIQESGQMYLETIHLLTAQGKAVRAIDVSEYMGYSKPSVSRAIGLLKKGGFLSVDGAGTIILTEAGEELAAKIYERHTLLTSLLMRLGVDRETASEDACRIEHVISDTTFHAIKEYLADKQ
jgi:Mn-dependent DtxR family transcriptional regulator